MPNGKTSRGRGGRAGADILVRWLKRNHYGSMPAFDLDRHMRLRVILMAVWRALYSRRGSMSKLWSRSPSPASKSHVPLQNRLLSRPANVMSRHVFLFPATAAAASVKQRISPILPPDLSNSNIVARWLAGQGDRVRPHSPGTASWRYGFSGGTHGRPARPSQLGHSTTSAPTSPFLQAPAPWEIRGRSSAG